MEIKIVKEKENIFLKLREIEIKVFHEGKPTPKKEDIKKALAEKLNKEEGKIEVKYILSSKGKAESFGRVVINEA